VGLCLIPPAKEIKLLGSSYNRTEWSGRAEKYIQKLIDLIAESYFDETVEEAEEPPLESAYNNLAVAQICLKKFQDANKNLKNALNENDNNTAAIYNLGLVKEILGFCDEAVQFMRT
jgi:tetratricopeptide (TPR) repeat protein